MCTFHRVDPRTETDGRQSLGQSVVVMAGLSALSWVVVVSIALAVRSVL
jgi:hypothetical protein